MNKKQIILIIFLLLIFHGCSESSFELINQSKENLNICKPKINHFVKENVITIEWEKDELADEYILYRDNHPNGLFNNIVYQGTKTKYEDMNLEIGFFYYYKLAKKRGLKYYPKSDYVYGVCSDIVKDSLEENNEKGMNNYELKTVAGSNIYCFRDFEGNTIIDTDWYKIDLGPNTYLHLLVRLIGDQVNNPKEVICNDEISLRPEQQPNKLLEHGYDYKIYNTSNKTKTVYFQICVEPNKFLTNSNQYGNGAGKIGYYTLKNLGVFENIK